jgi:hypothetical protein
MARRRSRWLSTWQMLRRSLPELRSSRRAFGSSGAEPDIGSIALRARRTELQALTWRGRSSACRGNLSPPLVIRRARPATPMDAASSTDTVGLSPWRRPEPVTHG